MAKSSFCQADNTFYILDTADSKYYNQRFYDYYNDSVIRAKVFYNGDESKIHYEFIRVNINKYYCIEYTADGKKINEGIAIKDSHPFDSLPINIYDSNGNNFATKYSRSFKFTKDEFWYENIDSLSSYNYGKYKNGIRDSIWQIVKDWNIESEVYYNNGKLIKEEKVNLAGTGDIKIKKLLERKWNLYDGFHSDTLRFLPGEILKADMQYLQFNNNGTLTGRIYGGVEISPIIKGSWELTDNNKKIKLVIKGKPGIAKIIYISKYGLTFSFEEL
ncbi:hypothetical protein [Ferruginibacter sp. SUN106]|uniref:hypothetical protein n=1 Tax=Ferruginibacter sp. SUN106 TaxID=2978348 RepID=UPI003D36B631